MKRKVYLASALRLLLYTASLWCIECIENTSGSNRIPIAVSVAIFYSLVILLYQYNCGIERTNCLYVRKRGRMNALEVAICCCCASSSYRRCRFFLSFFYSLRSWLWWLSSFLFMGICYAPEYHLLIVPIAVCLHDGALTLGLDGQCHRGDGVTATTAII